MSAPLTALDDAAWDSPWRQRRTGEKVACSLLLVLTALMAPTWPGTLLVAAASVALLLAWARLPVRVLAQAMSAPVVFLLLGGVSVLISVGASTAAATWWSWGPFAVGPVSAVRAAGLVAHGLAGTLAVLVLATTTPLVDLLTWLRGARIPDALLEIASLTYRLIFVFLATTVAVTEAQRARLGDAPVGPGARRRRWDNAAAGIGVIALRSWQRATRLNEGLANRGFESALLTLPQARRRSWTVAAVGGALSLSIWLASWAVAGRPWR